MKVDYLKKLRDGEKLSFKELIIMTVSLSLPAIFAQISSIVMQYIDAAMLGHLGTNEAAAIGLVASSQWLMGGFCMAVGIGFTVQIAQAIGAKKDEMARNMVRLGLVCAIGMSLNLLLIGVCVHGSLPAWLGGSVDIQHDASMYFLVFALSIPIMQINYVAGGMIQCSGNMKLPSILHIAMCVLDVIFNALLIFPQTHFSVFGAELTLPGFGLGVVGAALGTALSELVISFFMLYHLLVKSPKLHLRKGEHLVWSSSQIGAAIKLAIPVAFEQVVMCGAHIASTVIVAPLGAIAIATNSLSVTAESLCYMPCYGIGSAATTIIGQCIGAKREELTRKLAWLTTSLGMGIMACTGALMFVFAPQMIALLSPDPEVQALGTAVLRIEAFAEPLYGASIVATAVFRGAGDTLVPSCMNFASMWFVRIVLAFHLAKTMGLQGVWIAMCVELCFRGGIFLLRMRGKAWMNKGVLKSNGDEAPNQALD